MSTRILVVEDDAGIADLLRSTLLREGWTVEVARDGKAGMETFGRWAPDLVILDRMLPEIDGLEVLRRIRQHHQTPVLFLTVRDDETDKVVGLEMGADDYMTKPFGVRELVARVRTMLRRGSRPVDPARKISAGPLHIDLDQRIVQRDGAAIEMTRTEFELLVLMARHPGMVFSREELLDKVWGYQFEGYHRAVDTHVTRLRKKVESNPKEPELIETVWGVGYRFKARESA